MNEHHPVEMKERDRWAMILLMALVSIAFVWICWPFYPGVLWAVVAAIMCMPSYRKLVFAYPKRRNLIALGYTLAILGLIILPAIGIGSVLVDQAIGLVNSFQKGEIDLVAMANSVQAGLPGWAKSLLQNNGMGSVEEAMRSAGNLIAGSFRTLSGRLLSIGSDALGIFLQISVMLYLVFFFLRDGDRLMAKIRRSIPLADEHQSQLATKFMAMARATIKGSFIVALVQGFLGGFIFWVLGIEGPVLWGVLMGVFSLIPAVGTGIIWVPVAIYLLATGDLTKGLILAGFGVAVISMVDNVLRPILVGKDTGLPDWLLLVTTLGGMTLFGFNGILIGPLIAAIFVAVWDISRRDEVLDEASTHHGEAAMDE